MRPCSAPVSTQCYAHNVNLLIVCPAIEAAKKYQCVGSVQCDYLVVECCFHRLFVQISIGTHMTWIWDRYLHFARYLTCGYESPVSDDLCKSVFQFSECANKISLIYSFASHCEPENSYLSCLNKWLPYKCE